MNFKKDQKLPFFIIMFGSILIICFLFLELIKVPNILNFLALLGTSIILYFIIYFLSIHAPIYSEITSKYIEIQHYNLLLFKKITTRVTIDNMINARIFYARYNTGVKVHYNTFDGPKNITIRLERFGGDITFETMLFFINQNIPLKIECPKKQFKNVKRRLVSNQVSIDNVSFVNIGFYGQ